MSASAINDLLPNSLKFEMKKRADDDDGRGATIELVMVISVVHVKEVNDVAALAISA